MATVNLGKIKPLWKGDYSASETYRPLDFVEYNGQIYINILESIGNLPTNTTYFELVVEPNNIVHVPNSGLPNEAGTAYASDVTTSATDTTEGRLLKVGDFGLGANVYRGYPVNDFNSPDNANAPVGIYSFNTTFDNRPVNTTGIVIVASRGSGEKINILVTGGTSTPDMYFRRVTEGNISPWQKNYHTNNILGTVSQSGGVPTGAIIERGSNDNGEYVKYADGTQICTFSASITTDIEDGAGYRGLVQGVTYPASFVATPSVSVTAVDNLSWAGGCSAVSNNSVTLRAYTFIEDRAFVVRCIAIGRWY